MSNLSPNAKEAIVQKALSKDNNRTIKEIAKAHNIGYSTLQRWIKCHQDDNILSNKVPGKAGLEQTAAQRLQHVITTASLDETAIGVYCREHGIYSFQLTQWKKAFMTQPKIDKNESKTSELKALRAENKQLKQEVRRKDSALAETTALLVLKKKASLIWGEIEDD